MKLPILKATLILKQLLFKEVTKINKKTSQKILELKNDFSQRNATIQGVVVDTTNIVHLQREDGFSSFSFKIQQDINLNHFQNLVIENFPNGEQRTLLVKFNLNTPLLFLNKQSISNATTSVEVTNLSNDSTANRGTGSDCITIGYYETVDACEGELVTPEENPRCFNADGTRATKEVFITLAEDCSDGGGGDGGFNGNPDDPNNGSSNDGGSYNGSGIFIPNIYNGDEDPTNPDFVLSGQVATYFNSLPQNIKSLTNNNTWVYAYLVDYFRNHGNTVNNRNTPNATTALNNFYSFQLSSYSPNLSYVANEKLNFWAYYNFLNNNPMNANTQTIFDIRDYIIQPTNAQNHESIINYLFDNYENPEALEFVKELINDAINFPQVEGEDGGDEYDENDYDNLLTQTQTLPNRNAFYDAYPKILNSNGAPTPMPSSQVYQLVGGSLLNSHNNDPANYSNACAIRVSRALNYTNRPIPVFTNDQGQQKTQKGSDNLNYILDAASLLAYMKKTFPNATPIHLVDKTPAQIKATLNGKWGIYIMIPKNRATFGASGHADFWSNTGCINGSYLDKAKEIYFWELF